MVGISGGLDSTLALLVTARAFDLQGLDKKPDHCGDHAMFRNNGPNLSECLQDDSKSWGHTLKEVPIADAVSIHFRDIGHDPENHDVTYENSQARERTQVLMDIANAHGGHGDRNRRYVRTGTWAGQLTTGTICPCMESMRLCRKHWCGIW